MRASWEGFRTYSMAPARLLARASFMKASACSRVPNGSKALFGPDPLRVRQ